jgi:tRNA-dihydrouridine synthase A
MVRLISQNTLVYTEMVAANAIVHERQNALERHDNILTPPLPGSLLEEQVQQDLETFGYDMTYLRRFLGQGGIMKEGPSVLQLGGSDPTQLQQACETLLELTERGYCDYTAVNLNCGCPSPKVAGKGCFGAALMQEPELVRDLVIAMHNGCRGDIPITVKCRIGTDEGYAFSRQSYEEIDGEKEYGNLCRFIETVASSGVVTDFQVHARIAVLSKNFSPADNRKVPKLKYEVVRRLVEDYPELTFSLNGGINTVVDAKAELDKCPKLAGVMIGRAWAANPWSFAMADEILYPQTSVQEQDATLKKCKNRLDILQAYGQHADMEELLWDPLKVRRFITKAATPLFAGEPMGKKYRIALDEIAGRPKKSKQMENVDNKECPISELILQAAMENLSEEVLLRTPQESFEMLYGEVTDNTSSSSSSQRQSHQNLIIQDWQDDRKKEDGFQRQ